MYLPHESNIPPQPQDSRETRNLDANGEIALQVFMGVFSEFVMGTRQCREGYEDVEYPKFCLKILDFKAGAEADFQFDFSVENQLNEQQERDTIDLSAIYSLVMGELATQMSPNIGLQLPALVQFADSAALTGTPIGKLVFPTNELEAGNIDEDDYLLSCVSGPLSLHDGSLAAPQSLGG